MVPKLAVRAKAQHGSRRQQFWEGLPEHRLEASWITRGSSEKPLSWDLPQTPPDKPMPCSSPGRCNLSSLELPRAGLEPSLMILCLSTSPPGWSRTFSRWVAESQLKLAKVIVKTVFPGGSVVKSLPACAGATGSIPGPGRFHYCHWLCLTQVNAPASIGI